jgi:hypothetical protein
MSDELRAEVATVVGWTAGKTTFAPPLPLPSVACRHCGGTLAAAARVHDRDGHGFTLAGFDDCDFVHLDTGSSTCTITYNAQPYDGWVASKAYRDARAELDAAIETAELGRPVSAPGEGEK